VYKIGFGGAGSFSCHRLDEPDRRSRTTSAGHLVRSLAELGRFAEAMEPAEVAIEIAEATHHLFTIGYVHFAADDLHLYRGDWSRARVLLERSVTAFRAANETLNLPSALGSLAQAWRILRRPRRLSTVSGRASSYTNACWRRKGV